MTGPEPGPGPRPGSRPDALDVLREKREAGLEPGTDVAPEDVLRQADEEEATAEELAYLDSLRWIGEE